MGAWGPGPFDNDNALDWLADVLDATDGWTHVHAVLLSVGDSSADEYVDADDACAALAAAELMAARNGKPLEYLPDDVAVFIAPFPPASAEERLIAATAVRRVLEDSELRELWAEAEDTRWEAACRDTLARLDIAES